jgi:YjbR
LLVAVVKSYGVYGYQLITACLLVHGLLIFHPLNMVTPEETKQLALSLEGTGEKPHFDRIAFTVKKKIFATLSVKEKTLNLKFTPQVQMIFCPLQSEVIFAIPNGWGRQGWTTINLDKANRRLVRSALEEAYKLRKQK